MAISTAISPKITQLIPLLAQLGCIAGAMGIVIQMQVPQLTAIKRQHKMLDRVELRQEEAQLKQTLAIAKTLPTFGFNNIVADWHFINFIQYFGDEEVRAKAGYGAVIEYFDAILDRDPRFLTAYYYLSSTGSLYAGSPDKTVDLMNRGLKVLSPKMPNRSYYIWRLKAIDELLFLGKISDARNSMLTAANWASQYSDKEGQNVARISQKTANYLSHNPKSKQAQFAAWNMVLNTAVDDFAIKRAISEIKALGGQVSINAQGKLEIQPPAKD